MRLWLLVALLLPATAVAQEYRAPCADHHCTYFYPTAYYDHSGQDWNCSSLMYSGHRGSDYGVGSFPGMYAGRDLVAVADGTVIATNDGEFDECTTGNCEGGGGYGNYVKLQHADGRYTYYAHMRIWTVAVSTGQNVSCGQHLGQVGSSGYSTGPHIHFEVRESNGSSQSDPFDGPCSYPPSYWTDQGSHGGLPGTDCDGGGGGGTDADGDGYTTDGGDCDDGNASVHPGAHEAPDGVDNDCDGQVDEGTTNSDDDGDGYSEADGDCDDVHDDVYPGAPEIADHVDNDCDGHVDEGTNVHDDDGDGYSEMDGDCDDDNVHSYPGATEIGDGLDNDCDGEIDESMDPTDDDGDGYSEADGDCDDRNPEIYPGALEVEDGVDNDCDGHVDSPPDDGDDDDAWGDDDTSSPGDGGLDSEGCDCDQAGSASPWGIALLAGLVLALRRRA